MRIKIFWVLLILVALASLLLVYYLQSPERVDVERRDLRLANFYAPDHPVNQALREVFVPRIAERSGGRYVIHVYDSSALGAEGALTAGVRQGAIDMGIAGGLLAEDYPLLRTLELPFLFEDYAHVWRFFDSADADPFAQQFAEANLQVLAWIGNGFRHFSNSIRPFQELSDSADIRMRMPQNQVYLDTAQALGFIPIAASFSEVYSGLATGVFHGQDNPLPTFWESRFFEVQPYLAITNHIFSHASLVINSDLWKSLPQEDQQIFAQVAEEYAQEQRRLLQKSDELFLDRIRSVGVELSHPDPQALFEATESLRDQFSREFDWAAELIERIRAHAR